jgi:hypothetical protein
VGLDSGLPRNFYINRKDQQSSGNQGPQSAAIVGDGSNSTEYAGFDALVTPIASSWADYPPEVRLEVTMSGKSANLKATATDDKDTPRVEFFVDWVMVATRTAPPYEVTVDLSNHPRKYAYIYARAFDNTAVYRHEIEVTSNGNEIRGPYQQRAYSEVTEIGPEFLVSSTGNSGVNIGPIDLPPILPIDLTPPVVTITSPAQGASYAQGQPVSAAFTCADEAGGSGIATCVGDLAAGGAIDTTTPGSYSFAVTGTDVLGNPTRVVHNYTVTNLILSGLLVDFFDRPDGALVGPGWVEVEQAGASVSIANNRLFFDDTSDVANHPLVRRTFSQFTHGTVQWDFDFDWARTGNEGSYAVLMQLGEGALMSDSSPDAGVGVNLIWTNLGGADQNLAYRQAGVNSPLVALSGPAAISVSADLDLHTYSVAINGAVVQAGLPFDAQVSLDTVRFLTDGLNEANFSGRSFDNVAVSSSDAALPPPTQTSTPQVQDQSVNTTEDTLLLVTLTATDTNQCDLSFSVVAPPSLGSLGALSSQPCAAGVPNSDSVTIGYTPIPGATGIDSFQWQVNNGQEDSDIATVSVSINSSSTSPPSDTSGALLEDFFDRPDGALVGPGWVEVEQAGASVSIANNRLLFDDTSDAANHPLVRQTFSPVSNGTVQWDFDFDWARTGNEGSYAVLMQLGEGALMSDSSPDAGVGVNLIWTNLGGADQTLAYRQAGVNTPLVALSGPAAISVSADPDLHTYSVAIDGAVVQSGLPFDAQVSLDTVRFLTDGLNEANFSGRSFDNVTISSSDAALPPPPPSSPPQVPDQPVIPPPSNTLAALLEDFFDRPDGALVGPDWVEVEQAGASVSIAGNRLFFDDTSDGANHPLVRRTFSPIANGTLQWDFDFDWARTGNEGSYALLMQLGEGALMSDSSPDAGVGVNLIWTNVGGVDQTLAYRQAGVNSPLVELSGPAAISVSADLDLHTYSVAIDGAVVQAGLPFDAQVSLDTVRFLTDGLNEANFSGRSFDNVAVLGSN